MAVDINITSQIVVQTAAQWAADATVYSELRILVTSDVTYTGTDQRKFKIANGTDTWSNLDYFPVGSELDNYIYLSSGSNQTTTSGTLVDITDLVYALEANSTYSIEAVLHMGCNNTGGYKIAMNLPASSNLYTSLIGQSTSLTVFLHQELNTINTEHGTAFNRVNNDYGLRMDGIIKTSGTAGNMQMRMLSAVAGQTTTIYVIGTFIRIRKLA